MDLTEFINTYTGRKIDYDGAFGAQCVDLFRQYAKEVLGIKKHTGAVDGAKDLWFDYEKMPEKEFFIRIPRDYGEFGDVAVWDMSETNRYGHVAVVVASTSTDLLVFEQDGFAQTGARLKWRSKRNLLGFLRRS